MFCAGMMTETLRRESSDFLMRHLRYYYEVEDVFGVMVPEHTMRNIDCIDVRRTKSGLYSVTVKSKGMKIKKAGYNHKFLVEDILKILQKKNKNKKRNIPNIEEV
jgi:hypothetical protein